MFNGARAIVIAIIASMAISSCGIAESIRYKHKPSEIFYEDFDISRQELKPFINDEVLLAISVRDIHFDEYVTWLAFYTKKPSATIFIESVNLVGNGINQEIKIKQEYVLDENETSDSKSYDIRTNFLKLIDIQEKDMVKFFDEDNQMRIETTYLLNNKIKKMSFIIDRKIEKMVIFPT